MNALLTWDDLSKELEEFHAGAVAYEHGKPFDANASADWREGWLKSRDNDARTLEVA